MRDRDDFIENLKTVYIHLLILTKDIKYPLEEEKQRMLDAATTVIKYIHDEELKSDLEKLMKCELND